MANLTLSIDDKLLQAARVRAVGEGTSVNEICRRAIENYARAGAGDRAKRFDELMAAIDASQRAHPQPSPWKNRDEMYEEAIALRHPSVAGKRRGSRG